MASKSSAANVALARIGSSQLITNVDSDTSPVARAVRIFIDRDIEFVLRDFAWAWATEYQLLGLVGGTATVAVNYDWQYSYRYPANCLMARRIITENIGRNDPNPPEFTIGRDSQGKLLFTDGTEAMLQFTSSDAVIEEFDSMATSMVSWRLAMNLAPSQSRINDMAMAAAQAYEVDKSKAERQAANEAQKDKPIASEYERSRA